MGTALLNDRRRLIHRHLPAPRSAGSVRPRRLCFKSAILFCLLLAGYSFAVEKGPEDRAGNGEVQMSYRQAVAFLKSYTDVVELSNEKGGRLAVCPEWQGRVMTSSCDGSEGQSFGFLHREYIEREMVDPHFNNFGGEDRFWLSPEGGDFSLWFAPGDEQKLENWYTPPAFNNGAFDVVSTVLDPEVEMRKGMKFTNTAGTEFKIEVQRTIRLLEEESFEDIFDPAVCEALGQDAVSLVAFESINSIINEGKPMTLEGGLVSIWILGMYNSSPKTVVIAPYRPGSEEELGPVVKADYFGQVPPDRLKVLPTAVLLMADARHRSKIGIPQKRALPFLGSIDFESGVLTIVHFNMPENPSDCRYMNNMWGTPTEEPYRGDVVNAYNDGPSAGGSRLGDFYELETLSPARELDTNEALTHHHQTFHIQADKTTLEFLARKILNVELDDVHQAMFGK
jgi:hypothetical protein